MEGPTQQSSLESNPSGGLIMSRTRRLREEVLGLLENTGTANTVEIFDHLNERFRWGATMNQVGNIMAKDNRFSKVGHVRGQFRGSVYTVCVWGLSQNELTLNLV
tara:strand:- start:133 stop:447 length:315 start_codon:yes stop_codon:yes gene_type:complete